MRDFEGLEQRSKGIAGVRVAYRKKLKSPQLDWSKIICCQMKESLLSTYYLQFFYKYFLDEKILTDFNNLFSQVYDMPNRYFFRKVTICLYLHLIYPKIYKFYVRHQDYSIFSAFPLSSQSQCSQNWHFQYPSQEKMLQFYRDYSYMNLSVFCYNPHIQRWEKAKLLHSLLSAQLHQNLFYYYSA